MQVWRIDENNYFTGESYFTGVPTQFEIITPITVGYVKAKWTGEEWIEGATEEEIQVWKGSQIIKLTPEQEIQGLKAQLEQTDYRIIKCYEYQLVGMELPYDIMTLHTERQTIRDRINELE